MLEVEVKYRVDDPATLIERLRALGGTPVTTRTDEDHYFNAPDRDLKQTDEAFRMRCIGPENRLTYKGPKRDRETKTRTEIEVRLADGPEVAADMERMLICLGYRPVAVVRKERAIYHATWRDESIEVCIDRVDRVGNFVELEIVAEESRFETAKAAVLGLAAELGLSNPERRSYLGMLLAATAGEKP